MTSPPKSRSDSVRGLVKAVMDDLGARVPDLAAEVAREMHLRVPELGQDPQMLATTEASVRSTLELIFESIREGRDVRHLGPPPETLAFVRETVRRGLPFQVVVQSYGIGHAFVTDASFSPLGNRVADGEIAVDASALLSKTYFSYVDVTLRSLSDFYATERERWVRSASAVRAETVRSIVEGDIVELELASSRLRYPLAQEHLGFVLWSTAAEGDDHTLARLERVGEEVAHALGSPRVLLVPLGGRLVGGWLALPAGTSGVRDAPPKLEPLKSWTCAAFGDPGSGVDGFRRSHEQAQQARRVAQMLQVPGGHVVRYRDVAVTALVTADIEQARRFVSDELDGLLSADERVEEIASTLEVYLAEGCRPRRAAERLWVHENTVVKRVRRAEQLLGRRVIERPLELQVALVAARALRPTSRAARLRPSPAVRPTGHDRVSPSV